MKKYKAKRACFYGSTYYHEGQVVMFADAPDAELFDAAEAGEEVTTVAPDPEPTGKTVTDATIAALEKSSRPKQAKRD